MKDYLLDLVTHTYDLGCIDIVKVTGTDTETVVNSISTAKTVILEAKFATPVADFIGTFGMPNLSKLKILLNLPEYKDAVAITVGKRSDNNEPDSINFSNTAGDFKNSYRLMSSQIVNEQLKTAKFRSDAVTWNIEFEPTVAGILRLKMQQQANAESSAFQVQVENGNLKFYFGDHSTHAGNFVFHPGVSGTLKKTWYYPVTEFIAIMNLTGDKKIRISDNGVAQVIVNSGIAEYNYLLPAQTK